MAYHRVEQLRIVPEGIETSHDASHRGTCDDVNGDARTLDDLQGTDVTHTLGSSSTQHDSHFLATLLNRPAAILTGGLTPHATDDCSQHQHNDNESFHCSFQFSCKDTNFC